MNLKTCSRCDGSGTVDCPKCNRGISPSMPGKSFDPFRPLGGGEIVEDCSHCDGKGELTCPKCDGTGEIDDD